MSEREEDVLRFVAFGFLTKEIADRLQISIKTVETHKANAMSKMGMNGRIDIVRYAVLQGWLRDDAEEPPSRPSGKTQTPSGLFPIPRTSRRVR